MQIIGQLDWLHKILSLTEAMVLLFCNDGIMWRIRSSRPYLKIIVVKIHDTVWKNCCEHSKIHKTKSHNLTPENSLSLSITLSLFDTSQHKNIIMCASFLMPFYICDLHSS